MCLGENKISCPGTLVFKENLIQKPMTYEMEKISENLEALALELVTLGEGDIQGMGKMGRDVKILLDIDRVLGEREIAALEF
jgi:hypothetical protein